MGRVAPLSIKSTHKSYPRQVPVIRGSLNPSDGRTATKLKYPSKTPRPLSSLSTHHAEAVSAPNSPKLKFPSDVLAMRKRKSYVAEMVQTQAEVFTPGLAQTIFDSWVVSLLTNSIALFVAMPLIAIIWAASLLNWSDPSCGVSYMNLCLAMVGDVVAYALCFCWPFAMLWMLWGKPLRDLVLRVIKKFLFPSLIVLAGGAFVGYIVLRQDPSFYMVQTAYCYANYGIFVALAAKYFFSKLGQKEHWIAFSIPQILLPATYALMALFFIPWTRALSSDSLRLCARLFLFPLLVEPSICLSRVLARRLPLTSGSLATIIIYPALALSTLVGRFLVVAYSRNLQVLAAIGISIQELLWRASSPWRDRMVLTKIEGEKRAKELTTSVHGHEIRSSGIIVEQVYEAASIIIAPAAFYLLRTHSRTFNLGHDVGEQVTLLDTGFTIGVQLLFELLTDLCLCALDMKWHGLNVRKHGWATAFANHGGRSRFVTTLWLFLGGGIMYVLVLAEVRPSILFCSDSNDICTCSGLSDEWDEFCSS